MTLIKKNIQNNLDGKYNNFFLCLKDLIQYLDGFRQEKIKGSVWFFFLSFSNFDHRPGDCKIIEYKEFFDCKNVLLIFSDMNFEPLDTLEFYEQNRGKIYNEASLNLDIKRLFGQSNVRENIQVRYSLYSTGCTTLGSSKTLYSSLVLVWSFLCLSKVLWFWSVTLTSFFQKFFAFF